jgi:C-terminal processing protease CtpA/Prc
MSNEQSASIGLLLEQHNVTREIFVKSLMPGGPAHRDGRLQEGDQLLSVDSFVVQGQKLSAVFEMIKGIPGTKVTPTVHDQVLITSK